MKKLKRVTKGIDWLVPVLTSALTTLEIAIQSKKTLSKQVLTILSQIRDAIDTVIPRKQQ